MLSFLGVFQLLGAKRSFSMHWRRSAKAKAFSRAAAPAPLPAADISFAPQRHKTFLDSRRSASSVFSKPMWRRSATRRLGGPRRGARSGAQADIKAC